MINIKNITLVIIYVFLIATVTWMTIQFMGGNNDNIITLIPIPLLMFTWPILLNLVFVHKSKTLVPQWILFIISILQVSWLSYITLAVFILGKPDAQNGLVLFFAPIYSLPLLMIGWPCALYFSKWKGMANQSLDSEPIT